MMNEKLPNETMNDVLQIVMAMHRIPRTVRDESILAADNVVDCRDLFIRRSRMAEYLDNDCA
jgi:hypothetical protein